MSNNRYYSKNQDITFRMTSPAEEKELFLKAKAGDEVAREFLIRNHLLFAKTRAEKMVRGDLPADEVISAANEAVMLAYEQFDPHKGFRFTTYLRFWIRKTVSQLWRSKFTGGLLDPSASNSTQVNKFLDTPHAGKHFGGTFDPTLNVPDESPTVEELDLKSFNRECLVRAFARLPKKEANIMRLYYVESWTFDQIGKRYKVTRSRVQQIHAKTLKTLRRWLVREGVEK